MVRQLFWSKVKSPRRRNARKASDTLANRISRDAGHGTFSTRVEMLEGRQMLAAVDFNGSTYSQDFQAMTGTTTATAASLTGGAMVEINGLGGGGPAGWYTYMTSATGNRWFSSDTGSSNAGGFRQLIDSASPTRGRAFGSQGSGSAAGFYGIVLKNTSGSTINSINVSFDAVMNRNPSSNANPTAVTYRISSTDVVTSASTGAGTFADAAGTWSSFSTDLGFTSPSSGTGAPGTQAAISPLFKIATKSVSSQTVSWANNSFLYIRFSETDDTGSDSTQGVDNFSISANASSPAITGAATATAFTTTYGTASTAQSFSVSGSNLTANLVATAPTGFEVSSDGTTYGSTATFTQASGSASGTLRVRLAATAAVTGTSYNSVNVVLSSTGATSVNIATASSGNAVSAKALTITGLSAANKNWDNTTTASVTGTPSYSGLVNGEAFSVTGSVTWAFPDANVGASKTLTRTGSYSAPSTNYTVTQPTLTATISAVVADAPTINTITPSNGQLQVSFSPPASNGGASVTDYKYSLDGGALVALGSTSSPFTISGLTNGQTYAVRLYAVNSAGDSAASTAVNGTPAAPASPTVTVGGLSGTLSTTYGTASAERTFTVSGSTLSGNLTVTAPTGLEVSTTSGSGFADSLSLTASSGSVASTTVYVRLKATAAVSGSYNLQSISITGGGDDKSVVTSATGNIVSPKALTITGIAITDKVYDAGTAATITGTAAYSGLANGESFAVAGTASAAFADKTVAGGKSVTVTGYTAPSDNYTVSQPTGLTAAITAKALTVTSAAVTSRAYNATTAATITGTLSGVVAGDTVTFNGTGTFASANAGTGIAVTSTSTLGGADAANYSLTQPTGLTGDITKASQSITFGALANKTAVDAPFSLTATSNSGLTVSYTSSDPTVASISGSTVTILKVGSTTITASQAGNDNYNAASDVAQSLTVTVGPTTLAAGDVAFIQYDADNPDRFTFVTLVDLNAGTTINFTDNGFASATTGTTAEGFLTFTVPSATTYTAGTTFTWTAGMSITGTPWSSAAPTSFAFNTGGDQLFAFQGTTANWATQSGISLVAGLIQRTTWLTTGTPTASQSYQPSGLSTSYITSLATENGYFANGTSTATTVSASGTKSALQSLFFDGTNKWYNNATGPLTAPSYTVALTQPQTITFGALDAKTYGDGTFSLSATASSGLSVSYASSDTSVATVAGNVVTILKAGTATITASQAGNSSYSAATPVGQTLTVSRKGVTVTADGQTKVYGSSDPALTYVATGLVGSDTLSGSLSRAAGESVAGGPYAIAQGGVTNAANANYDITFVGANLSVSPKALTVTASDVTRIQGQAVTGGSGSTAFASSGLVGSETIGSVTIAYTADTATVGTQAGAVVASAATGGTFIASNYAISYVAGNLVVNAPSPAINATGSLASLSSTYGSASAAGTFSFTAAYLAGSVTVSAPAGFEVSTDGSTYGASVVVTSAGSGADSIGETTISVRLAASTAAGTYSGDVSISGGGATTQTVAVPSSTVAQKALTVSGLSASGKTYDGTTAASVSGTPSLVGIVGSDDVSLAGTATFAFATAAAGTGKSITTSGLSLTGAAAGNYSLTSPTLSADIAKAGLTISGISIANKAYDGTTSATISGTAVYVGLVNGEVFSVTGTPTAAFADAAIGAAKSVTVSGYTAPSGNYSVTQPSGLTADITKATQTITFGALANKNATDAAFSLTGTASSGLGVSYASSDTSVATVAGSTVTILKAGKVTITASQAGDDNYAAATPVSRTLFVLGSGSILFTGVNTTNPDQIAFVAMHDLPGTLAITFTDNAWSGSALGSSEGNLVYTTPAGGLSAGSRVVIERSASGNTATIVSGSGSVGTPDSGFTLSTSGDNVFAYTGTSGSPNFLAGVLTSVELTSGLTTANRTYVPAAISGATVQVVSSSTVANSQYTGTTTGVPSLLAAALVDRANWGNSASVLTLSTGGFTFIESRLSQTITFGALDPKTYGDAAFAAGGTSDSGLTVTYVSSDPTVATVSGGTITIVGVGTTTITASQAGNPQYAAATSVPQVLTVSAKALTITGTSATSRDYDGTTVVAITAGSLSGVVGSDVVTLVGSPSGSIADKNAGNGKAVTVSGFAIGGTAAGKYTLAGQPTGVTVDIATKALTISGASATGRVYDGTTSVAVSGGSLSGLIDGDDVTLGGSPAGTLATKNVGSGKAVTVSGYSISGTDSGNYSLSQPTGLAATITAAPLTITGASATNRAYNGSTSVAVTGGSLSGVIGSDDVTLGGSPTGTVANANAGVGKAVTVSGFSTSGTDSGNYSLAQPTGVAVTITPRVLSISTPTIASRVYNGTTAPGAVTVGEVESSGFVSGQTVLVTAATAAAYASANAGSQATTVSYTLGNGAGGGLASNYSLAPSAATGTVTAKALTITANNVTKKPGTTLAGGAGSTAFTSSGLVAGESIGSVSIAYGAAASSGATSGTYAGQVTPSNATGGTFSAANYAITYQSGSIIVSGSPAITVGGSLTAFSTTYGTATTQTLSIGGANLSGDLTVTAPAGFQISTDGTTFTSSVTLPVASEAVAPTTLTVRLPATSIGTFSGNLQVSGGGATTQSVAIPSSTVARKALTVPGASAQGKTYDGSTAATITGAALEGVVGADVVTVTGGGTFQTAAAGVAKTVTAALSLGGANAGNYTLTQPTGLTATIAQKQLTLSGAAAQNKSYDGTTAATITGTLSGVVLGDNVAFVGTGTFAAADRGTGIAVTPGVTIYSPSGNSAASYTFTQPTGLSANITIGQQSINAVNIGSRLIGGTITMPATSSQGQAVTYTSDDPSIASVAGNVITFNAAGFTKITATAAGTGNYDAFSYTQTVKVLAEASAVTLTAGDVVVLGYNAAANNPDYISFLFLRDLTPGTKFFVSDNEVVTTGGAQFADMNEAEASFTVKTGQVISAGTVVTLPWQAKDGSGITTSTDQYDWVVNESTPGLGLGGDEIYVYNANAITDQRPTSFIYGAAFGSSPSQRAAGLIDGQTFIRPSGDTMRYKTAGATYAGAPATLRTAIGNVAANWEAGDPQVPTAANYLFLLPQPQLVTFDAIGAKTYGDSSFSLSASAFSGGTVTFTSSDPTVASIAGSTVTILKAGSATITASVAGGDSFAAASAVQSLTVAKKGISVTADAKSKTYGDADPALTFLATGLVGSDTLSGGLVRAAGQSVGTYAISVGTLASANYTISSFTGADLTVNQKALTITAGDVTKAGNQTLSGGAGSTAFTAAGLVTGETIGSVTITYGDAGAAGYNGGASGTYAGQVTPSAATGGSFSAANYAITYAAGSVVVNSSPTISVSPTSLADMSTTYGTTSIVTTFAVSGSTLTQNGSLTVTAPTGFQVSLDGTTFASSRTIAIDGTGAVGTTTVYVRIPGTTAAGTYGGTGVDVTVTGGGATAKAVATTASTVAKKELTVTGLAFASRVYDGTATAPAPSAAAFAGLVNGQSFTPSGSVSWAFADKNVGVDKPLTRTGTYAAPSANYTVVQPTRTASITAKALSITADTKSKQYGNADPSLTFSSTGLVGGDSLTGNLARGPGANVGTYAISQGTLSAGSNYAINFTGSTLTIAKRAVTIIADALSKIVGQSDPTLTWKVSGATPLASGDNVLTSFTGSLTRAAGDTEGTYAISQGTLDGANYAITFQGANFTINAAATPLKINGVFVKGSTWAAGYQSLPVFTTVGSSNLGWRLADGTAQLMDAATIPWNNVNTVSVRFNQAVTAPQAGAFGLVFGGSTAAATSTTSLGVPTLLEGGTVAQWTLGSNLTTGKYRLVATSGQVASAANAANTLDGEWTAFTSTFATGTGDGTSGGDFAYDFDVLVGNAGTGDINSGTKKENMAVNVNDNTVVTGQVAKTLTALNFRCDVNGDGKVDSSDQTIVQAQIRLAAAASLTSTYYFDPIGRPKRS